MATDAQIRVLQQLGGSQTPQTPVSLSSGNLLSGIVRASILQNLTPRQSVSIVRNPTELFGTDNSSPFTASSTSATKPMTAEELSRKLDAHLLSKFTYLKYDPSQVDEELIKVAEMRYRSQLSMAKDSAIK